MSRTERSLRAGPLPEVDPAAPSSYGGPSGFCWLIRGWLAGAARPGIVTPLEEDLAALRRQGADVLVTLTKEWLPPVQAIAQAGMESRYMPITDMAAPTVAEAVAMCREVASDIAAGKRVVYQCKAGRGRTGTMLAAQLIWHGEAWREAIVHARHRNPLWIESEAQLRFLEEFANEIDHLA